MVTQVISYACSNGEMFQNRDEAVAHELKLQAVAAKREWKHNLAEAIHGRLITRTITDGIYEFIYTNRDKIFEYLMKSKLEENEDGGNTSSSVSDQ